MCEVVAINSYSPHVDELLVVSAPCISQDSVQYHGRGGDLKSALTELPALYGGIEILTRLKDYRFGGKAREAIDHLSDVVERLQKAGYGRYLAIDLGMVSALSYYTGIIFQGFVSGFGTPILSGGRYDHLVEKFGPATPATGFSVNINFLLDILAGNGEEEESS